MIFFPLPIGLPYHDVVGLPVEQGWFFDRSRVGVTTRSVDGTASKIPVVHLKYLFCRHPELTTASFSRGGEGNNVGLRCSRVSPAKPQWLALEKIIVFLDHILAKL